MNTQNEKIAQYLVAFQYLKPNGEWSKWYPLVDYVNVKQIGNKKVVVGTMLYDLPSVDRHSLELGEYYNKQVQEKNLKTQFKFMPAKYNLEKQEVITIHEYDWTGYYVQ